MSFLYSAIKDYIYPIEGASVDPAPSKDTDNSNNATDSSQHQSSAALNPYSIKNNNNDRIIVQPPGTPALSVPSVSLSSLQLPTISTQDSDSDSDHDSKTKASLPVLTVSANSTPAMTLSTAEAPDEATPSFPALNGPQRLAACSTDPKSKRRIKFALAPGHSPLDWARLTNSGTDLRGVTAIGRYTLTDIKAHNKADDAWTVLNGKVYNITPYLPFHPGGEKEILRCAGRDGTRLFNLTHKWVNYEFMLKECQVGFLISEASSSYQLSA
ncbi:hypothetical protein BC939DRAFT_451772 [Gamsiella multidivaricata]|uniref:uncharacterized protein n=1 Tax=Gamsiella multidivaricata TaxID=101098 RepID=UPI00221EE9BD|nr:uncharacterized protein BC939DRAFT_451772 [Gamsiella multidivaricata]KAG0366056.1 hypothetical protein BGZ54_005865 [Gamsiella multidivaricata]KAI7823350.1 hypothetical protein BC939DRAFT_451772 [Gamsiella multidivaricata]